MSPARRWSILLSSELHQHRSKLAWSSLFGEQRSSSLPRPTHWAVPPTPRHQAIPTTPKQPHSALARAWVGKPPWARTVSNCCSWFLELWHELQLLTLELRTSHFRKPETEVANSPVFRSFQRRFPANHNPNTGWNGHKHIRTDCFIT